MQDRISFSLGHLSDAALLSGLAELTHSQWTLTATIVAHLAEVDTRKLYLTQATSSLFAYCRERLGFSEDEACRRVDAARLAQRYPAIYAKLESGEVTLSVLGRLKPFLSEKNADELLTAVSGKSVRDAERILAARFPKPDVPDSIRKLPERKPAVSPARSPAASPGAGLSPVLQLSSAPLPNTETPARVAPARAPERAPDRGRFSPLSADRIQVRFTASRELEEKLELARDLMSHSNPRMDLATVIEAALDLLIAKRMKQKLGQTKRPQKKSRPAKRTRITNATRREVVAHDGLQCSFVDEAGRRCSARAFLELDHREPKANGGGPDAPNVRLLCREHNQGEAERVFGREHMERCRKKRKLTVRDGAVARYERGFRAGPPTRAGTGLCRISTP